MNSILIYSYLDCTLRYLHRVCVCDDSDCTYIAITSGLLSGSLDLTAYRALAFLTDI
jgi:hypothetical protein